MYQYLSDIQKQRLFNAVLAAIVLLAVFLGFKSLNTIKEFAHIGDGVYPTNTITINGKGEIFAVPDVAEFSFSVVESGATVAEAQGKATTKMNSILEAIKAMNIEEKDIKTTGYNSYPKYEYRSGGVCTDFSCPPSRQVLIGYEVSQNISVKVRNTDMAGEALTKVGGLGASNISSLNFVTDDIESVRAEARDMAIKDAKEKAKVLSKSLGVRLGDIISYSEYGDYPMPYYGGVMMAEAKSMDATISVPPELPVGENQIISNVSITYEVR